jgi:hypothetical protein
MTTMQLPEEIQLFLAEQQLAARQALVARAKADPVKHKATLQFEGRLGWRYYGDIIKRGKRYRYGWTTTRNAAGYFLSFREVIHIKKGVGERDQITASKTRSICKARALARFKKHRGDAEKLGRAL